jgi:hypothetical protein
MFLCGQDFCPAEIGGNAMYSNSGDGGELRECGNEIAQATKDEGGLGGVGGT